MSDDKSFNAFAGHKYLNLETLRKNGEAVRTPVWFAADDAGGAGAQMLYAYSLAAAGKVKRIRNNPRVRIAPCDMRGKLLGEWGAARAEIVTGEEAARAMRLLDQKYFPWRQLLNFFAFFHRRERAAMVIRPE